MAIQIKKHKKTFPMWFKVKTDSTNFQSITITISQNGVVCGLFYFYVKYTKNVKFLSGSRGPHGPDLPSPWGQTFQLSAARGCFDLTGIDKNVEGVLMSLGGKTRQL